MSALTVFSQAYHVLLTVWIIGFSWSGFSRMVRMERAYREQHELIAGLAVMAAQNRQLIQEGYELTGLTMRNFGEERSHE